MRDVRNIAVVVVGVAIGGTAAAGGAYLPTAWGWAALGPAAVAAAALLLQPGLRIARAAAALVVLLTALVAWTALSLLWTDSVPRTVAEIERDLVYLATVGAVLALPRSRLALTVTVAASCTGVCIAGLVTRLFPSRYGIDEDSAYRLVRPLGYWNAMGVLAAIAAVLAVGIAVDAKPRALRAVASAAPVVIVPTLLLSQSRGAVIALAVGIAVAIALHRERGRFAVVAAIAALPAAAAAIATARSGDLTAAPSSLAAATRQGHRLGLALLVLAAVALLVPRVVDAAAPRLPRLPRVAPRTAMTLAVVATGIGLLAAVAFGGKAYDAFRAPTRFGSTGPREHLLSLSGHGRSTYWRVALDAYETHPALGSGAGTYDLYWTRDRPFGVGARDAHSLYVETLAELGPVGLLLLVAALAAPFAAVAGARDRPLVPALAGAFAAYLVHAAGDWDWELPTVTLVALICGALLADADRRAKRVRARPAWAALAAATAALALVAQHGNNAVADASASLEAGRNAEAVRDARRASRWAPWAAEPWRVRADAERALGRGASARRDAREAMAKDPHDWLGWYQLAYLTHGRAHEAAAARVRELNPLAPPVPR